MGSGSKITHQNYALSPAVSSLFATVENPIEIPEAALNLISESKVLISEMSAKSYSEDEYDSFAADIEAIKEKLNEASSYGGAQISSDEWSDVKKLSKEYLEGLSPAELQKLAGEKGFSNAGLVGIGMDTGTGHPLAFWLNPYYDAEEQKEKIQSKATSQYERLQSSGEVVGKDGTVITKIGYLTATPPDGGVAKVVHTPEEITKMLADIDALRGKIKELNSWEYNQDKEKQKELSLSRLEFLERQIEIQNTVCSDPSFEWENVSPGQYGEHLFRLREEDLKSLSVEIKEKYGLDLLDSALIYGKNAYYSAYADNKFAAFVAEHSQGLESGPAHLLLKEKKKLYSEIKENLGPLQSIQIEGSQWTPKVILGLSTDKEILEAKNFFEKTGLAKAQIKELEGNSTVISTLQLSDDSGMKNKMLQDGYYAQKQVPKMLRTWAKEQKIGNLRTLAHNLNPEMEFSEIKALKRAQLQNLIIGSVNEDVKQKYINPPVIYKNYNSSGSNTYSSLPGSGAGPKGQVVAGIMMPAKPVNFNQKCTNNVESLLAMAAAHAQVQDRPTQKEVENMPLQPTSAITSGGAHSKSFYKDDKGRTWMFKPDNTAGGARADAEAAASEIMYKIGLPSVPVRTANLEGKKGAIQPMIPNTTDLSGNPSSWSQSDVDNLVRMHVGSWLVGDHDGNNKNILKTEGGGIVPIDQGQAFKFVGRDRLSIDYHPNSSFGSIPAYDIAYQAALGNGLSKDVRVRPSAAVPVIDKIEAMKDDEFRELIRPTAESGAASQVEWRGPMEKKAKKMFGTDSPTTSQIAEAFLDTVVERKQNIRKDFSLFYAGLGFVDSETMAEVS